MGKKILILITILLISSLLAGWYFFTRESRYFGTSAFSAVSENVAVILRIHQFGNYTERLLKNKLWNEYAGFQGISSLNRQIRFADSLFIVNPKVNKFFIDKDLTVMAGIENDHFWNLYLIELLSLTEKRALSEFVDDFFTSKGATTEKVKSGAADINVHSWLEAGKICKYYTAFYRGLFLVCTNPEKVLQAIKLIEAPETKRNSVFEKANKTATNNFELNIYLNHKKLPQFAEKLFSKTFINQLKVSSQLAEWSEIDLNQKSNELLFNGFSFTGDSLDNYLEIFLHQQPGKFNLAGIFPAETSFFLSYNISNNSQFFFDYEKLLAGKNQLIEYKNSLKEINSLYGVDIQKIVADNLDFTFAVVFTRPDPVMRDDNKFLVIRTGSGSKMENAMIPLTIPEIKGKHRDLSKKMNLFKVDKETVFKIYKTPVVDFGKRVFGGYFSEVVTSYFTFYDNCLIMGSSYESLGRFLRANVLQETLENSNTYKEFTSALSDRMNFYLWTSPGKSFPFFKNILNDSLFQNIENQINAFHKIESAGWQIGVENGMIYNMARLKYNPEVKVSQASVVWKSHLGNPIISQPQFVINPDDKKQNEIVVQDSSYNFLLVGSEGRVIWKIKLPGPIRSEIFQLDYFKDGNLQYFFNTDDAFHLIDHNGNYIRNYPVSLRSTATNSVAVVDYDRKKDYRFIIAGKDHKVYLYDKKGNVVTGWNPPKTEHDVIQPIQYFMADKKDYIIFADKNRGYILDRKGKTRVSIKGEVAYSRNSFTFEPKSGKNRAQFVTTDSKGSVVSIGLDGLVKKVSLSQFSPDHYFFYDDLDSDKKRDYIILDGDSLVVFDQSGNQFLTRKLNHSIGLPPLFFTFPDKSRRIGVTDTTENRIYLFNSDGSLYKGFPIEGNSKFVLGFSGFDNGQFNLITGTADGYLNNYLIK